MSGITVGGNSHLAPPNNTVNAGTTTDRTLILKQIVQLQKSEAALGKKTLALGNGFEAMSERIELEHEMHGIDEQIKALQNLLLQKDADRKVQSASGPVEKSADAAAVAAKSTPTSTPTPTPKQRDETVGSVIDVQA